MTLPLPPPYPPIEPPPARVELPDAERANREGIVALSRTMSPGLVLQAYRKGIFPWPIMQGVVPWASPDPRAVFPLRAPRWPRHVRRARALGYTVTFDRSFREVMTACGQARAEGTWITPDVLTTYSELHALGWAHSAEVWLDGSLVGGLYGLAVGSLFAGESMFHARTGASKVAFAAVTERLVERKFTIFDVQVMSPHLETLGCVEIARSEYLRLVEAAIEQPRRFSD
ncbi:MAG TPA: leucyl/phenylalanyl-tRNA--protein transferase [Myxococcales bacterium]|nr:leucyl/phenylalanyl-tRNA--protein transferase [Myxococcales bacterium]